MTVALATVTSTGIGLETALLFARRGHPLFAGACFLAFVPLLAACWVLGVPPGESSRSQGLTS
jgi:hypothetical protein